MKRRTLKLFARRWHRLLMWLVSAQLLIWAVTGLYMVSVDIHDIHGDRILAPQASLPVRDIDASFQQIIDQLHAQDMLFSHISLRTLAKPMFIITTGSSPYQAQRFASTTAQPAALPLQQQFIIAQTQAQLVEPYRSASVTSFALQSRASSLAAPEPFDSLPDEVSSRYQQAYRISLDTWDNVTLYVHPTTGEIITKRHSLWRIFDWAWRFHITDYDDGANVHNRWLQLLAIVSLAAVIFGSITLIYRFKARPGYTAQQQYRYSSRKHWRSTLQFIHKCIAIIVVVPLFIWLVTGLALSLIKPDPIHSFSGLSSPSTSFNLSSALAPAQMLSPTLLLEKSVSQWLVPSVAQHPIEVNLVPRLGQWVIEQVYQKGFHPSMAAHKQLLTLTGEVLHINQTSLAAALNAQNSALGQVDTIVAFTPTLATLTGYQNPILAVTFNQSPQTHYFDAQDGRWLGGYTFKRHALQLMRTLHFMDYVGNGQFNYVWNIFFAIGALLLAITGIVSLMNKRY